jgi:uncharacterized RDD family membrane protein YckC
MHPQRAEAADVAAEAGSLMAGLGILTIQIFPFSLPLLVLVVGPLVPLAVVGLLLAAPVVLSVWLVRVVRRAAQRAARTSPASSAVANAGHRAPTTRLARSSSSGRH